MIRVPTAQSKHELRVVPPLDCESKLEQAIRLLEQCGFRSVLVDMDAIRNGSEKTAVICRNPLELDPEATVHTGVHLPTLTPQQAEVLKSIGEAKPNKRIAFELGIAEATVKAHVTNVYRKLGVRNRSEALLLILALRTSGQSGYLNQEQEIAV